MEALKQMVGSGNKIPKEGRTITPGRHIEAHIEQRFNNIKAREKILAKVYDPDYNQKFCNLSERVLGFLQHRIACITNRWRSNQADFDVGFDQGCFSKQLK